MSSSTKIYQFKIRLKDINPMIWRRFLIRSNNTLKDLHYVIQILISMGFKPSMWQAKIRKNYERP